MMLLDTNIVPSKIWNLIDLDKADQINKHDEEPLNIACNKLLLFDMGKYP